MSARNYALRCIAPDGDMGSRWFFYPVSVVTGDTPRPQLARIIDAPRELRPFIGKRLSMLTKYFAENAEMICDWINGESPFLSPYPYA
jgi:hypothetical protein